MDTDKEKKSEKVVDLDIPFSETIEDYARGIVSNVNDKTVSHYINVIFVKGENYKEELFKKDSNERSKFTKYMSSLLDKEIDDATNQIYNYYPSELHKKYYQKVYSYLKNLENLEEVHHWSDIIDEMHQENYTLSEIFVRLVEEQESVSVTGSVQLQDLVGIYSYLGYYYNEDYIKLSTEQEQKQQATREFEITFLQAMFYRYLRNLEDCLNTGGKYKELLNIKPVNFNLHKSQVEKLKDYGIKYILATKYNLLSPDLSPDLQDIAKILEAPYPLMLEINGYKNETTLIEEINKFIIG